MLEFSSRVAVLSAVFVVALALNLNGAARPNRSSFAAHLQQEPIRASTDIVKISASVQDDHGNFLGGLTAKQFRVLDNGVERPIAFFVPDDAPSRVVVMIETSPAVYLIQQQHLAGAYALLDGLAPDDQVALIAYDEAPRGLLGFTSDRSAIATALGQLQYTMGAGQLNLFASISQVLDWIAPLAEKKAMVLLTTGLDSSPPAQWDALQQKLRTQDFVIFPVALGGSLRTPPEKKKKSPPSAPRDPDNPLSFAKSDVVLRDIAAITGGRAFFPESSADFVPAYRQIAAGLRHQYILGIAPEHDGKIHSIEVQLLTPGATAANPEPQKSLHIFARREYQAPAP